MTDATDTGGAAGGKGAPSEREAAPKQRFRHSHRLGLVRMLMINLGLIAVPVVVYFVVVMKHTSAYSDERSLRALQEIGTQIDNRIETLRTVLEFKPSGLKDAIERRKASSQGEISRVNPKEAVSFPKEYLHFPVLAIRYAKCGEGSDKQDISATEQSHGMRIYVEHGREPLVRMVYCDPKGDKEDRRGLDTTEPPGTIYAIDTSFSQMIENTASLGELPLIFVAGEKGDVYAQLMRNREGDIDPPAHEEVSEDPKITGLQAVIAAADKRSSDDLKDKFATSGGTETKSESNSTDILITSSSAVAGIKDPPSAASPHGLPVAFDTRIAGTSYRAYVLPYPSKITLCLVEKIEKTIVDDKECGPVAQGLYLIGLRKGGALSMATSSLSPGVLLGAVLAVLAACIAWPFLRQAMLEPNDAVTWRQVRILCLAFLVFVLIAVVSMRSLELSRFMYARMNEAAASIANEMEASLTARVSTELGVLEYLSECASARERDPRSMCLKSNQSPPDGAPWRKTSAADSYFQTNELGWATAGIYTYDAPKQSWSRIEKAFDLKNRPYFYLLATGHGVWTTYAKTPFILQRLFNKGDGKKILQLAAPKNRDREGFEGIDALNIGMIEFISPVLPLGMGYAIFEKSTGTVVFHADDSRSLIENFYAETEHNAALSAAVESTDSLPIPFTGRYRGADARFVYKTLSYTPWGLAVYYPSSLVSAIMALAVVSALATSFAAMLTGLLASHLVIRFARRRYSWLWPQWRLRDAYPTLVGYLGLIAICEASVLHHQESPVWNAIVLASIPLLVATACFRVLGARTRDNTAPRRGAWTKGGDFLYGSFILHVFLVLVWAVAAAAASAYLACLGLLGMCGVLGFIHRHALENDPANAALDTNPNAWRREGGLWPGICFPTSGRQGFRVRYIAFLIAVTLVVSAVPAWVVFDRTFEAYAHAALDLSRSDMAAQWDTRIQRMEEDERLVQVAATTLPPHPGGSVRERALALKGLGIAFNGPHALSIDRHALFGESEPVTCSSATFAWPMGAWEHLVSWQNHLLEDLRQGVLRGDAPMSVVSRRHDVYIGCGLAGTIDELMRAGLPWYIWPLANVGVVTILIVLIIAVLVFSIRHVTGISRPWSGRFGPQAKPERPVKASGETRAIRDVEPAEPLRIVLLQPSEEVMEYMYQKAGPRVRRMDAAVDDLGHLALPDAATKLLIVRRVEMAILEEQRRVLLLATLERWVANGSADIVLIADVSPVYRIARPHAYPGPMWAKIGDYERMRWIDLFTRFQKIYRFKDLRFALARQRAPGSAIAGAEGRATAQIVEFIYRETRALWPCLRPLRESMLQRWKEEPELTDRDVIELVALNAEVHYRKAWEYCTRDERLALYQIAQGKLINMANHRVVEHLLRRGFIVFEPEPRIKSISMAEFILNAELPGRMEAWAAEAAEGLWQSVRVPIFVALMLVLAWIAYSSGDAFQAVVALAATSVAVIGQALRLFGLAGLSAGAKDR